MINSVVHTFARRFLSEDGASAVEFALIAPVIVAGLLGAVDVGLAVGDRMSMDQVLRSAAQAAMSDPGIAEVQGMLDGLSYGTDFSATAELSCPCPADPACSQPCTDPSAYNAYRLRAAKTYDSMITPLQIPLETSLQVQVK